MTDRTAAEVMCCPEGSCQEPGYCWAECNDHLVRNLHAAGYMIVPRSPTDAMREAASASPANRLLAEAFYRAMTAAGELK